MKKEYGWVDYTNLALNVAQTAQLQAVRGQLAQLQQAHLDERARAQIEDDLRQAVFEKEQLLKQLLHYANKDPMAVHLHCWTLKDWFDKTGVAPSVFREFNDKDRVQKILAEIGEAIDDTCGRLDPESRNEVDECRRFVEEDNQLNELIGWLKTLQELGRDPNTAQAEILSNEAELQEKQRICDSMKPAFLQIQKEITFKKGLYGAAGLGCMLLAVILSVCFDKDDSNNSSESGDKGWGLIGALLDMVLLLGGPALAVVLASKLGTKAKKQFKAQHQGIDLEENEKRIEELKVRCDKLRVCLNEIEKLYARFGKLSEAQIAELQKARERRIEKASSFSPA